MARYSRVGKYGKRTQGTTRPSSRKKSRVGKSGSSDESSGGFGFGSYSSWKPPVVSRSTSTMEKYYAARKQPLGTTHRVDNLPTPVYGGRGERIGPMTPMYYKGGGKWGYAPRWAWPKYRRFTGRTPRTIAPTYLRAKEGPDYEESGISKDTTKPTFETLETRLGKSGTEHHGERLEKPQKSKFKKLFKSPKFRETLARRRKRRRF